MARVIMGVTISLDGFAEDRSGSVGPLYPDLAELRETEVLRESIRMTGSVIMAWKEYTMADDPDSIADNYEYQVPIFVITDRTPARHPRENDRLTFTFVTNGLKSAVQQAREAAGERDVTVIGSAATTRQFLKAGLADELHVDIVPVFLKDGFRPFDDLGSQEIRLEKKATVGLPSGRTHLEFRVVPPSERSVKRGMGQLL